SPGSPNVSSMCGDDSCMRLYAYLGGELVPKCSLQHLYRRWIKTYRGEAFGRLVGLLDRVATDTREVRNSYRYALQCELDFFSDVIRSCSPPPLSSTAASGHGYNTAGGAKCALRSFHSVRSALTASPTSTTW